MKQSDSKDVVAPRQGLRVQGGKVEALRDNLAVETPFELRIGGRSQVLLMVCPQGLEALARGHCLSEGLVSRPEDILKITLGQAQLPGLGPAHWADVELPPKLAHKARVKRVAPSATSCGLCGLESFKDLGGEISLVTSGLTVELEQVVAQFQAMLEGQEIFAKTGATHAAALGTPDGELVSLGEDVGRHNALDKALGLAMAQGRDLGGLLATVSGRISFEMALKAARAGVPLIGSVSAATALGQSLCQDLGVTLVAFVRQGRATVFSHPQRVLVGGVPLSE